MKKRLVILFILICGITISVMILTFSPVKKEVILEAGQIIKIEDFKNKDNQELIWKTDIETIDTNKVGEYEVVLISNNKEYKSQLIIQDTTAPKANVQTIKTGINIIPDAINCLKDIEDASEVNAYYKEEVDVSSIGEKNVVIILEDAYHNSTELLATIQVIVDEQAPTITGTKNKVIYIGDTVSYREGVSVNDNCDQNVELFIDTSQVNNEKEGIYDVIYSATDASGNKSEITIQVFVEERNATKELVFEKCDEILKKITHEDMSSMEIAFEIYKWTKSNIGYASSTEKSSWVKGAYQGLFKRQGDCYTYFATCKGLLTRAGINNIDIERYKINVQRHYWSLINLGDGWYHVDATPRLGEGDNFFMCTTEELKAYKSGTHNFKASLYPEIATKSLQHMIDYDRGVIVLE